VPAVDRLQHVTEDTARIIDAEVLCIINESPRKRVAS
jgi:hypothetical protein